MSSHRVRTLLPDERGAAAIEFAILVPVFLMLLVGTITMSIALFTSSSLHFATEAAARCASVNVSVCKDAASTTAYAMTNYFGSSRRPVFSCVGRLCGGTASCGNKVTGTVTITIDVGVASFSTPLRADACYP